MIEVTEEKLAFREKHNPKDQSEEVHFVMMGCDRDLARSVSALSSPAEGELSSSSNPTLQSFHLRDKM